METLLSAARNPTAIIGFAILTTLIGLKIIGPDAQQAQVGQEKRFSQIEHKVDLIDYRMGNMEADLKEIKAAVKK